MNAQTQPTEVEVLRARQTLAASGDIMETCAALDILKRAGLRHKEPKQDKRVQVTQEQVNGRLDVYMDAMAGMEKRR